MLEKKTKSNFYYLLTFFAFATGLFMSSCQKDTSFFEGSTKLRYSVDTLFFDTVFTTIGSATRTLKVYNDESKPVQVDVRLSKGQSSFFRFNADGHGGNELKDIEILANDSIYIFLEATIDPDQPNSISPFVIEEQIIITHKSEESALDIVAWGQNANYISQRASIGLLSCDLGEIILDDQRPYVIYGILLIDSCNLVIPKGAKIHVHGGIVISENQGIYNDGQILVLNEGRLTVNGTVDEPVIFEGTRLEPEYAEEPGQWGGLRFLLGSSNNNINHAVFKNSIVGLVADSSSELTIKNAIIENTSASGIIGIHANIYGENLLLRNNGGFGLQLTYGGNYEFNYCTIGSYINQSEALYLDNKKCLNLDDDPFCVSLVDVNAANLKMQNCAIAGGSEDEILFDDFTGDEGDDFNFEIANSIVRVKDLLESSAYPNFFDHCIGCLNHKASDPLFVNQNFNNFHLDSLSVAIAKAQPIVGIDLDLEGNTRDVSTPDIGCYEF